MIAGKDLRPGWKRLLDPASHVQEKRYESTEKITNEVIEEARVCLRRTESAFS